MSSPSFWREILHCKSGWQPSPRRRLRPKRRPPPNSRAAKHGRYRQFPPRARRPRWASPSPAISLACFRLNQPQRLQPSRLPARRRRRLPRPNQENSRACSALRPIRSRRLSPHRPPRASRPRPLPFPNPANSRACSARHPIRSRPPRPHRALRRQPLPFPNPVNSRDCSVRLPMRHRLRLSLRLSRLQPRRSSRSQVPHHRPPLPNPANSRACSVLPRLRQNRRRRRALCFPASRLPNPANSRVCSVPLRLRQNRRRRRALCLQASRLPNPANSRACCVHRRSPPARLPRQARPRPLPLPNPPDSLRRASQPQIPHHQPRLPNPANSHACCEHRRSPPARLPRQPRPRLLPLPNPPDSPWCPGQPQVPHHQRRPLPHPANSRACCVHRRSLPARLLRQPHPPRRQIPLPPPSPASLRVCSSLP
jgi:hypothetical protein